MTFLHPEFLYLMLPPVLVLFFFILTQKDPAAEVFDARLFERLRVNEKRLSLRQRNLIYLVIFILLITAMAQPVVTETSVRVEAPGEELMVAVDISASMRSDDLYPSRLAVAKAKLQMLIDRVKAARIGILAFGKDVYVVSPPSGDKEALRQILAGFAPDAFAEKGTDFMALLIAANGVMAREGRKNLLLLTDGGDGRGFSEAIAYARAQKMHLYVLGTATPQGAPLRVDGSAVTQGGRAVRTALNPFLEELASETGGRYRPAVIGSSDVTALIAALREQAEGGREGVKEIRRYGQLFVLPLGAALVLLLIALSSMSRRERVALPPVVLLGLLLSNGVLPLQAEAFDYEVLNEAKRYYDMRDYPRAAREFYRYAKRNDDDPAARYDSACALYRAGRYEAAAALWGTIHSKERLLQFKTLYNIGNAHAMLGGVEHLEAAIKAYQSALYLENDRQTRENLEIVLGRLIRLMQAKRRAEAAAALPKGKQEAAGPRTRAETETARHAVPEAAKENEGGPKPSEATAKTERAQMSDFEAGLWMKSLRRQTQTHLYKITPQRAGGGEDGASW